MSIFKKIKSIGRFGLEPIEEGMANHALKDKPIEEKAVRRALTCVSCPNYVDEPIDLFKIKDERIPELDGKMCDECGCALPYLLRQDLKVCTKWNSL